MPVVDITVKTVAWPKPGKKKGWVISSEDGFYGCVPGLLTQFKQNEVCKIEYKTAPKDGGGEWMDIIKKIGGGMTPMGANPIPRPRTNPTDSKQIFVTALLKEFIAAGRVDTSKTAVVAAGTALKQAYEELFGSPQKQETEAIMEDQIPDGWDK